MSVVEGDRNPNKSLQAAVKTRSLASHTVRICANPKVFDPAYDRFLTSKIVETAVEIHMYVWAANCIRVDGNWQRYVERAKGQSTAKQRCNALMSLIDLAKPVYHLSGKRAKYWMGLVREARSMIDAWSRADYERYKNLKPSI